MPNPVCADEEFIKLFKLYGSPQRVAKELGISVRSVHYRRRTLESRLGAPLVAWDAVQHSVRAAAVPDLIVPANRHRLTATLDNGTAIVFSDAHYWPGEPTVAHRALLEVCKQLKPKMVIANGDVYDGARISRHEPMYTGTMTLPTPQQELDAVRLRMAEVEKASKGAHRVWTIGNHDSRLHRYIAVNAPELSDMPGVSLWDYFNGWEHGWSLMVNGEVMVKHRYHNGIHATYNNTLKSGVSVVTGHLHRLCVTPWGDYRGRRYGVDTGTLSDPLGDQYTYLEGNPTPWCSGFAVLTFKEARLLPPELCEVIDGHAYFRGQRVL